LPVLLLKIKAVGQPLFALSVPRHLLCPPKNVVS